MGKAGSWPRERKEAVSSSSGAALTLPRRRGCFSHVGATRAGRARVTHTRRRLDQPASASSPPPCFLVSSQSLIRLSALLSGCSPSARSPLLRIALQQRERRAIAFEQSGGARVGALRRARGPFRSSRLRLRGDRRRAKLRERHTARDVCSQQGLIGGRFERSAGGIKKRSGVCAGGPHHCGAARRASASGRERRASGSIREHRACPACRREASERENMQSCVRRRRDGMDHVQT